MILSVLGEDTVLNTPVIEGYVPSNTSVVLYNSELLFQTRYVSYLKHFTSNVFNPYKLSMNQNYIFEKPSYHSRNVRYGGGLEQPQEIYYSEGNPSNFCGFEDARLVVWDDELYTVGARADKIEGKICMSIENRGVEEVLASPFNCRVEKNWMPIEGMPQCFVYGFCENGLMLYNKTTDNCTVVPQNTFVLGEMWGELRGSTPLISFLNGFLCIVHKQERFNGGYSYKHAFVFLDRDLQIKKISNWFTFHNCVTEFCTGLCIKDDTVYITYSQLDAVPMMLKLPQYIVIRILEGDVIEGYYNEREYYRELYKSLETQGQYRSLSVVSNHLLCLGVWEAKYVNCYMGNNINIDMFLKMKYNNK